IPEVQRTAGESGCHNNLRSVWLGLRNYHDTYGRFPPGTIRNEALPAERRLSWTVDTWSFIEAHMMRHARTQAWDAPGNRNIAVGPLRVFQCPANPAVVDEDGVGLAHYVGVPGLGPGAARPPAGHPG